MNPNLSAWLLVAASVIAEVAGTVALKYSDGFSRLLPSGMAAACYALAIWLMAVAMRPGQAELLSTVDNFVARNTANGELNKLYRKWLETDLPKMQ